MSGRIPFIHFGISSRRTQSASCRWIKWRLFLEVTPPPNMRRGLCRGEALRGLATITPSGASSANPMPRPGSCRREADDRPCVREDKRGRRVPAGNVPGKQGVDAVFAMTPRSTLALWGGPIVGARTVQQSVAHRAGRSTMRTAYPGMPRSSSTGSAKPMSAFQAFSLAGQRGVKIESLLNHGLDGEVLMHTLPACIAKALCQGAISKHVVQGGRQSGGISRRHR